MDLVEAILERRSIRAFKNDPVPQVILNKILETAVHAPSWQNIQPWEFVIVAGKKLDEIRQDVFETIKSGGQPSADFPYVREFFPEPWDSRTQASSRKNLEAQGIAWEDKDKRFLWTLKGLRLFDAPCSIYILIDRDTYFPKEHQHVYSLFDCGMVAQNIMLLAHANGLGTVPQISGALFPEVVKKHLQVPDNKLLVMNISVGYPDMNNPLNQVRSGREKLSAISKWQGF